MEIEELSRLGIWLRTHGVTVLLIIIGAVIVFIVWERLIRFIISRIKSLDELDGSELDKRTETIGNVLHSAGIVVILATSILMIMPEFGIDITPILASVGIIGLAAGLGAQTLVKDVISGMFILIENQYTVGDVIEVNGVTGTVEMMTLRVTALRDISGTIHTIPMGDIRNVANKSRDWSRAIVDVSITYEEDVDMAVEVLNELAQALLDEEEFQDDLQEEPLVTGVEGLDDWAVRLRVMVKTNPGAQWEVQRWLRRRIRLNFEERGIALAFPRQEIAIVNLNELTLDGKTGE